MWTAILTFIAPILSAFKTFFLKNKGAVIVTSLVAILLLVNIYQYNSNRETKKQLAITEHNLKVANDSVRITKDKAGKDEANHLAYYVKNNADLQKLNKDLALEVKNTKGKVNTIVKEQVKIVTDTVYLASNTTIDETDSTITTDFNFDTTYNPGNFRKLKGFAKYDFKTKHSNAQLTQDEIGLTVITGIKNLDKGKPEIFVRSNYPGFTVTQIDGAVLDPKIFKTTTQRRISVGLNLGFSPISYNLADKKIETKSQITFGAGINYRIF